MVAIGHHHQTLPCRPTESLLCYFLKSFRECTLPFNVPAAPETRNFLVSCPWSSKDSERRANLDMKLDQHSQAVSSNAITNQSPFLRASFPELWRLPLSFRTALLLDRSPTVWRLPIFPLIPHSCEYVAETDPCRPRLCQETSGKSDLMVCRHFYGFQENLKHLTVNVELIQGGHRAATSPNRTDFR